MDNSIQRLARCLETFNASRDKSHALGVIYGWLASNPEKLASITDHEERINHIIKRFEWYWASLVQDAYTLEKSVEEAEDLKAEIRRTGAMFDEALIDLERMIGECEADCSFLKNLSNAVAEVCKAEPGFHRPGG